MMVRPALFSADEFFQLPEAPNGHRHELVRGEIVTFPAAGMQHGVCSAKAVRRIGGFVEVNDRGTVACNDTGFITEFDPDTVRGPDLSYWSSERLSEIPAGYSRIAPDFLVEVLSPSNTARMIRQKLREYFAAGVSLAWVISPEDRTLTVYRTPDEGRLLHDSATVTGEDILPGFSCRVSDLLP